MNTRETTRPVAAAGLAFALALAGCSGEVDTPARATAAAASDASRVVLCQAIDGQAASDPLFDAPPLLRQPLVESVARLPVPQAPDATSSSTSSPDSPNDPEVDSSSDSPYWGRLLNAEPPSGDPTADARFARRPETALPEIVRPTLPPGGTAGDAGGESAAGSSRAHAAEPTPRIASLPEIRRIAPWLARDAALPGPHGSPAESAAEFDLDELAAVDTDRLDHDAPLVDELIDSPPTESIDAPSAPADIVESEVVAPARPAPQVPQPESAAPRLPPAADSLDIETPSTTAAPQPAAPAVRRPRTPELEAVARRADEHTHQGFELAGKQAYFSARAEFIRALRLLAGALDAHQGTRRHGEALAAGLRALEEAEDFVPSGNGLEAEIDLAAVMAAHRTPIVHRPNENLTAMAARQRYYTYAQQQLGQAVEGEVAGSVALYGLGKLYTALSDDGTPAVVAAEPSAMVFQQAALLADPYNALAANEVGVLLARHGRYVDARGMLLHSLRIAPHGPAWHNLAVVHSHLGEGDLARLAEQEYVASTQARVAASQSGEAASPFAPQVDWLTPTEMARRTNRDAAGSPPPTAVPNGATPEPEPEPSGRWSFWPQFNRK